MKTSLPNSQLLLRYGCWSLEYKPHARPSFTQTHNTTRTRSHLKDIVLKIKEWYRLLLGNWKLLLLAGVVGAGIGLVSALLKTTTYKAELVFVTAEGEEGGMGKLASLGSQFGLIWVEAHLALLVGDNLLELMKSRRLVEQTLFDSMFNEQGERVRLLERYLLRDSAEQNEDNPPVELLNNNETPNYKQDSLLAEIHEVFTEDKLSVGKTR